MDERLLEPLDLNETFKYIFTQSYIYISFHNNNYVFQVDRSYHSVLHFLMRSDSKKPYLRSAGCRYGRINGTH